MSRIRLTCNIKPVMLGTLGNSITNKMTPLKTVHTKRLVLILHKISWVFLKQQTRTCNKAKPKQSLITYDSQMKTQKLNKLTPVFHASVLLLIMNFVKTLSKWLWMKLTSICFFTITNFQIVRPRSLLHRINYKFMCLSAYWRSKISQWARENLCCYRKKMSFCYVHIVVQFHHWYKHSRLNTPIDQWERA